MAPRLLTHHMRTLLLCLLATAAAAVHADFSGRVVSVHDGDSLTIVVDGVQIPVHLAGIDAPKLGQAFGDASRQSLVRICLGQQARVVERGNAGNGSRLGHVTCGNVDANTEQVRRGMAWVVVKAPKRSPLFPLQEEARVQHIGLWSDPYPTPPWQWRARTGTR
jgi:endonuclease YncB( thermonuclease family)